MKGQPNAGHVASAEGTQSRARETHFEGLVGVKGAARFLCVSKSLVYAYVERKQIPITA